MLSVDVSASTAAFVGTVCLIAVRRSVSGRTGCRSLDVRELVRPLVSVHRLVLLLPDMYRLLDPSVHSVAFSVDDLGLIPIYDAVERDSMICDYWLVLFLLCSMNRDLPTLRHLGHPVRPETKRQRAIRQTVSTKAAVEAETSTLINKRLFYWMNFTLN